MATASFNAHKEGFSQAYITYKGFTDTVNLTSILPLFTNCVNKPLASGNLKNPAVWSKGRVPDICDSIVIQQGHTITADTSLKAFSLRVDTGGVLNINNEAENIQLGEIDAATSMIDLFGTLNLGAGNA